MPPTDTNIYPGQHNILLSRHICGCFNSRAHGGRDELFRQVWRDDFVSIHAPTGGATGFTSAIESVNGVSIHAPTGGATHYVYQPSTTYCFNSRAHGGRDRQKPSKSAQVLFQFTRPRGARLCSETPCLG